MGCVVSQIDNEESVTRCKDRKNLMKQAVAARYAFSAAYSGYAAVLKDNGAALSDFGCGEIEAITELHALSSPPLMDAMYALSLRLPPPPPPPLKSSPSPIKRAISMPVMALRRFRGGRKKGSRLVVEEEGNGDARESEVSGNGRREKDLNVLSTPEKEIVSESNLSGTEKEWNVLISPEKEIGSENNPVPGPTSEEKGKVWDFFLMEENMPVSDHEGSEPLQVDETGEGNMGSDVDEKEPKTPEKMAEKAESVEEELKEIEHEKDIPSVNLQQILNAIDDQFLKTSASASEVSKMLAATRSSDFLDNPGCIDHSARVVHVITWNKSFQGTPNGDAKDNFDSEEHEPLAIVLDKLLAWEKKLYKEMKQEEQIKLEYRRKVALLKKKKRDVSAESLEKIKAGVSDLHTRYIVDMQSLESTVAEVTRIRDSQLYPKLAALVDGMAKMWGSMCMHHCNQLQIVENFKSLSNSAGPKETTKQHHECTHELWNVAREWHSQFEKLAAFQKNFVQILYSWLKLNLIPVESSSLQEKISSASTLQDPPILALLQSWHDLLEEIPDELAKSALTSFAAVFDTIMLHQEKEMKLKEKCKETRKEYLRKKQAFEEWHAKYMQRQEAEQTFPEMDKDGNPKDPLSEKQLAIEVLRKIFEEEVEAHQRLSLQVRKKSLVALKVHLPELFRAMSDYAHTCAEVYGKLRSITHSQNSNSGS